MNSGDVVFCPLVFLSILVSRRSAQLSRASPPAVPQGMATKPPGALGATGEGLDSSRDSEGSYVLVWGRIW